MLKAYCDFHFSCVQPNIMSTKDTILYIHGSKDTIDVIEN